MIADFIAGGAAAALVVASALVAPWRSLEDAARSHAYFGAIALVTLAWTARPEFVAGVRLHYLGATRLYLMFGARLALVALAAGAALAAGLTAAGGWSHWVHDVLAGAVAIAVSRFALRFAETRLPPDVFVFIFVGGFAAAALAVLGADALALAWASPAEASGAHFDGAALVAVALMMAFSEATLTGMLAAVLVAFRPSWLARFDEGRYLARRQ